jgi:hypothetical protein
MVGALGVAPSFTTPIVSCPPNSGSSFVQEDANKAKAAATRATELFILVFIIIIL